MGLDWREHVEQDKSLFRPSEIRSGFGIPEKAARVLGWSARITAEEVAARMANGDLAILQGQSPRDLIC